MSKSNLRVLQWNANGINTKIIELEARLLTDDYDICCMTYQETKRRTGKLIPKIRGYTSIRLDCPRQDRGGGLLTYIKDTIIFERVQETYRRVPRYPL